MEQRFCKIQNLRNINLNFRIFAIFVIADSQQTVRTR